MKLKNWLRLAGIGTVFGVVAFFLGQYFGLSIIISLVLAVVAVPVAMLAVMLIAMFAWSKRHRGD